MDAPVHDRPRYMDAPRLCRGLLSLLAKQEEDCRHISGIQARLRIALPPRWNGLAGSSTSLRARKARSPRQVRPAPVLPVLPSTIGSQWCRIRTPAAARRSCEGSASEATPQRTIDQLPEQPRQLDLAILADPWRTSARATARTAWALRSRAANCRAFLNLRGSPALATSALAVIGPIPGRDSSR